MRRDSTSAFSDGINSDLIHKQQEAYKNKLLNIRTWLTWASSILIITDLILVLPHLKDRDKMARFVILL